MYQDTSPNCQVGIPTHVVPFHALVAQFDELPAGLDGEVLLQHGVNDGDQRLGTKIRCQKTLHTAANPTQTLNFFPYLKTPLFPVE